MAFYFTCKAPEVNLSEVLRYSRQKKNDETVVFTKECISKANGAVSFSAVWDVFDITVSGGVTDLGPFSAESASLAKMLCDYSRCVVFAATIGADFDRLTSLYERKSPGTAVVLHGYGAERVESLCDELCGELEKRFGKISPRFSPGYGDLPLGTQTDIFRILSPEKIGLFLNSSLLMSPSKSVTAFVGVSPADTSASR
ncbi:MAG: hypothetical protein K6C36_09110 [Clostridia bacterium]|nr:hypothetical protein [Clostridia bacterium]